MFISNNSETNVTQCPKGYREVEQGAAFDRDGRTYKEITYEKNLSKLDRLGAGLIALLETFLIFPYVFYTKHVNTLWKQAIYGTDRIKLISSADQNPSIEQVRDQTLIPQAPITTAKHQKIRHKDWRQQSLDKSDSRKITPETGLSTSKKPPKAPSTRGHTSVTIANQKRRKPPRSLVDTIGKAGRDKEIVFFSDDVIVEKLPICKRENIGESVFAYFTQHGKAIIQQQAIRGCTAAVTAMLIMDHQKRPNLTKLTQRNLGDDDLQAMDLREADLKPILNKAPNLKTLRELLLKNGSAIVHVYGKEIGAHVIIVDEISQDLSKVRIRDPYHGWEITVTAEAFLEKWTSNENIIQVEK